MNEVITKEIDKDGTIICKNGNGDYHNINDKPAVIWIDGDKCWFKNGNQHRTKGPAEILNKREFWYYEGKHITSKVNQLMEEGKINPDWENWTEEDEFLFVLLVS